MQRLARHLAALLVTAPQYNQVTVPSKPHTPRVSNEHAKPETVALDAAPDVFNNVVSSEYGPFHVLNFSHLSFFFFLIIRRPPISTLFPYTALSRSRRVKEVGAGCGPRTVLERNPLVF